MYGTCWWWFAAGFTRARNVRLLDYWWQLSICTYQQYTVHLGNQTEKQSWSNSIYIRIYTVSTKKLHPCIHCHNSGKQRRILTQFYANTETLNCKEVTKLQQNRSTSATATASLVRSLKKISVHYRHRRDWLSSVRPCKIANGKTSAHLKSVFKMSTVCSNASLKTWSPLPARFIDDQLVEMFLLFDRSSATSAGRRHESGCSNAPAASPKSGSRRG